MTDARARRRQAALALVAVLGLGAGGLALWLRSRAGDAIPSGGHGGGGGEVGAPEALRDGEGGALASNPRTPAPPGTGASPVPVEAPAGPVPATDLPTWKDLRFALVDAVTGLPLDGSVVTGPPSIVFGRGSARVGLGAHAQLRIEAAPGFVAAESTRIDFDPELATAGVSVVYPLHRAIDLELAAVDAEERPAEGASVISVGVDGRRWGGRVEAKGAGRFLLHDLPYAPHSRVAVEMTWAPEGATEAEPVDAGSVTGEGAAWSGRMPDLHAPRFRATATLRGGRIQEVPSSMTENETSVTPPPRGLIRVRVRGREGQPTAGARVWLVPGSGHAIKAGGTITFARVPEGTHSVSLADPRLVPTTVIADVRDNEITEVELVEPEAAGLDVTVVDAEGKGIPVARVEVETPSGMPALDLVDGVLRIDPYTDQLGRRTFTRVEPGAVTVRAWGHGGTGETQVVLRPGMRSSVTVVVR